MEEQIQKMRSMMAAVGENHRKLDRCACHDFEAEGPEPKTPLDCFYRKYRCRNCDGRIGKSEHFWYQIGLRDGAVTGNLQKTAHRRGL